MVERFAGEWAREILGIPQPPIERREYFARGCLEADLRERDAPRELVRRAALRTPPGSVERARLEAVLATWEGRE